MAQSDRDYRQSLNERLKNDALKTGVNLDFLRKQETIKRFLCYRLQKENMEWILKGAMRLEAVLVLQDKTLTGTRTKDADLAVAESNALLVNAVSRACGKRDDDRFHYRLLNVEDLRVSVATKRAKIIVSLSGKEWCRFALDLVGDELDGAMQAKHELDMGVDRDGESLGKVLAQPTEYSLAEKLHAYSRERPRGKKSTRRHDLPDMVLLATTAKTEVLTSNKLIDAVNEVFAEQGTTIPEILSAPPPDWSDKPMPVRSDELPEDLGELYVRAKAFWDPVLASATSVKQRVWNGSEWLAAED